MKTTNNRSQARSITDHQMEEILDKLKKIEAYLASHQLATSIPVGGMSAEQQVLLLKLGKLTLKRHAVLTAALAEVSYQDTAKLMKCSETTIKLHLKAAMTLLDIPDRSILLSKHKSLLSEIPDDVYEQRFGISKSWYLEDLEKTKPHLLEVLTNTKPAANQHTAKEVT